MKQTFVLPFLLVFFIVDVFGQATIVCTYTDKTTGYQYDLTPLVNNQEDYVVEVPAGTDNITTQGYKITLNVCRPIFVQACSTQAGTTCDACLQWPLPNTLYQNALGKTTSTNLMQGQDDSGEDGEGVSMFYGGFTSTLVVNFLCDPDAGVGAPVYVTKPTSSEFLLKWKSKYACAVNGPAGGGSSSSSPWSIGRHEALLILGLTFTTGCLLGILVASFCWCLRVRSVKAKMKRKALDESRALLLGGQQVPSAPAPSMSPAYIYPSPYEPSNDNNLH
mmetsp:Transcript_15063/g.21037  ORF Transcript_15063/g.21037 Transcript_15063/m.21037 type:complete len:277 (+) Transcript_15063:1-831(+)